MANYSVLKAAVQAVVKTNGNQEITGANMQSTLISIINSLGTGYQFMGVATPSTSPGTPDHNVAYIGGAGTYANFGTSVTVPVGSIGVFKYNGSWTKEQIKMFDGIDDVPVVSSDNLVKSGGVAKSEIGINQLLGLGNIPLVVGAAIYQQYWIKGDNYSHIVLKVQGGETFKIRRGVDNIYIAFLTDYFVPANTYTTITNFCEGYTSGVYINTASEIRSFDVPTDCRYIVITIRYVSLRTPTLIELDGIDIINGIQKNISDINDKLSEKIDEERTIFFNESKNLFDSSAVELGIYLNTNGSTGTSATWAASDYIPIDPSHEYIIANNYATSGGANIFYDSNKQLISWFRSMPVAIPSNAAFVRLSINYQGNMDLINYNQLEYGQVSTPFEPYGYSLKSKYLVNVDSQAISLPKKIYLLTGVNFDIFYEPILKKWNPYRYNVKVETSQGRDYVKAIKRVCTLNTPTSGSISFKIYDAEKEGFIANATASILKGTASTGSNTVKLGIIGDSYTDGGCFTPTLLDSGYVPNLQMVGTRSVNNSNYINQRLDGRAGWALQTFFNIQTGADMFNPFYHPQGSHRYWGNTAFWKNVCGGSPSGYGLRYTHYSTLCNTNGFPVSPVEGDVIYDSANSVFKEYQSGSWVQVATTIASAENYYTWEFSYSKYLSMWSIDTADIFCVYLGVNDYWITNEPTDESLERWKGRINTIISSYHSVNSAGKFVLLCPNTVTNPNTNHYQPLDVHRRMWKLRNFIIENFDNRESELIYVVDTAHLIDSENSYTLEDTIPFDGYPNGYGYDNKVIWSNDGQHPRVSYTTLGYSLAGFIQYMR